jgi:hypothetical protein
MAVRQCVGEAHEDESGAGDDNGDSDQFRQVMTAAHAKNNPDHVHTRERS